MKALNGYRGSLLTKYATQLLILTGVRTIELRAAEWSEFDLKNALWEIPKERTKKRRSHLVPLSTQAVEILNELKVISGKYQLEFPGRNDVSKPMSDDSINKVIKMLGYHGRLTGHGFSGSRVSAYDEHDFA